MRNRDLENLMARELGKKGHDIPTILCLILFYGLNRLNHYKTYNTNNN